MELDGWLTVGLFCSKSVRGISFLFGLRGWRDFGGDKIIEIVSCFFCAAFGLAGAVGMAGVRGGEGRGGEGRGGMDVGCDDCGLDACGSMKWS